MPKPPFPSNLYQRYTLGVRGLIWLLVLFALLGSVVFGLTDLDEGFYASVAWEMHQRGDWLTPTFQGKPWFEKPPLLYWLMMASMRLFGENPFALRLPSVVMYGLILVVLGLWGNRRLDRGVGTLGALLFAVAPLSLLLARLAITDMALCFWLLLTLIALWELPTCPWLWAPLGGIALGLAVLTKGPVGFLLMGLLYLWNACLLHQRGLKFRWVLVALLLTVATCVPWYAGVYFQHGEEFFSEFVLRQNLLRFAGGDTAHSVLPLLQRGTFSGIVAGVLVYLLFYGAVLVLGAFPMVLGGDGLWRLFGSSDALLRYLARWSWLVFGLFTLSFTKLPAYIFPMFPALALLVAWRMSQKQFLSSSHQGKEARTADPPLSMEDGLGMRAYSPVCLLLFVLVILVWGTASGWVGWQGGVLWAVLLPVGMGLLGVAMLKSLPSSWLWAGGVLAIGVGMTGALMGYDRLILSPVRELALSTPPYRVLILYRVNPGYPSLLFYRRGQYDAQSDWNAIQAQMQETGAYCLTTDSALLDNATLVPVGSAEVLGRRFYLLAPRYQ